MSSAARRGGGSNSRYPTALAVAELPLLHRNPYDRILVAQARHLRMTIVTDDPQIARYDVETILV